MKFTFGTTKYSENWDIKEKIGQLFFIRSLPRSGKSTFAKKWLNEANYYYRDLIDDRIKQIYFPLRRVVVCADDFRLAAYGKDYDNSYECIAAAATFTAIKALLKNHCVLFDDTNSSEWSLRRIFEICPQAEYIHIGTDKEVCLERNKKTKMIPEFVFDRIEQNLMNIDPEDIRKDYL